MAHNLEERDGSFSFVSILETAWHKLGTVLDHAVSSVSELMALARADYEVEMRPYTFTRYTDSGDTFTVASELAASIVRTDTQEEIGTGSLKYPTMNNADAFAPIQPLVDARIITLETCGVLGKGEKAFMVGKVDTERYGSDVRAVFEREGITGYFTVVTSHTGGDSTAVYLTKVRGVCANTIAAGMASASVRKFLRHQKAGAVKMVESVSDMFAAITAQDAALAQAFTLLRETKLTEEKFRELVLDVIAPLPDMAADKRTSRTDSVVLRQMEKREAVTALWTGGRGHTGDMSAWEAYNGAVEALDHHNVVKHRTVEAQFESTFAGAISDTRNALWSGLLEYAQTVTVR